MPASNSGPIEKVAARPRGRKIARRRKHHMIFNLRRFLV
jgi:hypothetical protein